MRLVLFLSACVWGAALLHADTIYLITLDTSALVSEPDAGPFSIDFQMLDGSGLGDANNTISATVFDFGGGSDSGSPSLVGGASGDLAGGVSLNDSSFFNEFTEGFTPGSQLSFTLSFTTNVDSSFPDSFAFAIEDWTGTPLPTQGIYTVGADSFLTFSIDSSNPTIDTFASDLTRVPAGGGDPLDISAPSAVLVTGASVPEPSTSALLLGGIGILVLWRARVLIGLLQRAESRARNCAAPYRVA